MKKSLFVLLFSLFSFIVTAQQDTSYVSGSIYSDETWHGVVYVTSSVAVETGATLTIKPGTVIHFKYNRDYMDLSGKAGLLVMGNLQAIGTPDSMIWFTSAHPSPINGDWAGIEISNSTGSEFKYCIIEFAELGIGQYFSSVDITHSIVRWNNSEGIYGENSTAAVFEYNRLYENAYHEIALENNNTNILIQYNEFGPQNRAINFQSSGGTVKHNYIHDYSDNPVIAVTGDPGTGLPCVIADSNLLMNCDIPIFLGEPIGVLDTSNGNDYFGTFVTPPIFDFPDTITHALPYCPGDTIDQYPYVYDSLDYTRHMLRRYGKGLGFGWAMCVADGFVWKLDTDSLYRIDTLTGNHISYKNSPIIGGPGGLCFDGMYFWAYDRDTEHDISKFEISGDSVHVLTNFLAPEASVDRALGLTTDSVYLYQASVQLPMIYKFDMAGNIIDTIHLSQYFADLVVWDGSGFIGTGGELGWGKWDPAGQYMGSAFQVANGCWAMDFDGQYVWSHHKTCEMWNDAKIFKTKILNFSATSINENQGQPSSSEISIYPNPTNDYLQIEIEENGISKARIFNLEGKLFIQESFFNAEKTIKIKTATLTPGNYILEITDIEGNRHHGKFIKE